MTNDTSLLYMLANNNINIYLALFIIFYSTIKNFIQNNIIYHIENYIRKFFKWHQILIVGYHCVRDTINTYDFPEPYIAVCHYINEKNLSDMLSYFNIHKNNVYWYYYNSKKKADKENYIIESTVNDIHIENDIYISVKKYQDKNDEGKNIVNNLTMTIKSKTKDMVELQKFINNCVEIYKKSLKEKSNNKLYHFIYQGIQQVDKGVENLIFTSNIISDMSDENNKNYETFDCLFHEHKDNILKSINKLKDLEYYKKFGLKRKKGYLFYGKSGCGKTSTTMAIANHCKRHIIEIPLFRVETNLEIERILNLTTIHGVEFKKDEIIFLFDEIDMAGKCINKRKEDNKTEKKDDNNKEEDDDTKKENFLKQLFFSEKSMDPNKLSLGTLLSRLDGIGNYSGLIFIATTNYKDKLDPALFRHGRLEPLYFNECRQIDVKNIIEHFFQAQLSESQTKNLPDRKITPATLVKYIQDYENNLEDLLKFLKEAKFE